MKCIISTPGRHVVLTLTADLSLNAPNLNRTDLLLNHVVSSPVSILIIDFGSLSRLNSVGTWTIFQVVFKAQEHGKVVFLYNVQPSVRPLMVEAGILTMVSVLETKKELDTALRRTSQSPRSTGSLAQPVHMHGSRVEGF